MPHNAHRQSQTLTRSGRLWTAVILGSLSAFGPLSLDMYLPSLPKLADDLHTTTSLTQLSLTACLIGLALGQLFAGPISDVRGRRIPLLVGLIGYTASSLLCAFAPSIWTFILLRFVQGLAGSAGIVIARAVVRDLYSGTELTKFFSLLMLVNGIAPIAAPIAGGQLLHFTSWRGVFLVLAVIGVIMLLAVLLGLPETLPAAKRMKGGIMNTLSTFRTLARNRVFVGYALCQGLVLGAMFAYISGSPFVLQDIFGVSPQMFSLCFAINGLGIILASQVAGRLAGRVNETKLLLIGLCLAAFGGVMLLGMILISAGLAAILIFLFIIVSCVGLVSTLSFSLAMRNLSHSAGSASALLGVLTFLLGSLAAPLVGLGGSLTAVPMGIIIAVMEVGALLIFALLVLSPSSQAADTLSK
ncbi:Bcr/CflA family drug resistance efflux transporter [Paenibacillus baekrokdamisoli]|uniref:Bcr/CflA family efflux transporter n=1 Tax=Paenibacillus baekrokdamisoli TaxID=1712516 RepID=A0A3G9JKZ1_9BACL|nr:multidrug effflux MFS transporter [Paenibacillus baekrokdamisoli]MBB3068872.1 DHA1 family bicyclomycin/chloramphenicol resistance-like MFS transporter [Paenibacillus baekrokdamisoli]BBH23699.1 Bcr/CflA family drug resistance efflux transporter [Paenibacillus baekrokdamisoli]